MEQERQQDRALAMPAYSAIRPNTARGSGAVIVPPVTTPDSRLIISAAPETVHLVDVEERHIRRPGDLVAALISLLAMAFVLLVALLGPETTAAVTEDVQSVVGRTVRQFLLLPVTLLEGIVIFSIPVAVLLVHAFRRQWRIILQVAIATFAAYAVAHLAVLWIDALAPHNPLAIVLQPSRGSISALSPYVASLAALLTGAGRRSSSTLIRVSWWALLIVVGLGLLQGNQTLPGAISSLLIGRMVGFLVRYALGVRSARATGISLIRGLRRAGIKPEIVVRLDAEPAAKTSWLISSAIAPSLDDGATDEDAPTNGAAEEAAPSSLDDLMRLLSGAPHVMVENPLPLDGEVARLAFDPNIPNQFGRYRRYAVYQEGTWVDVGVLDGDQQVVDFLAALWESLRFRGLTPAAMSNLRDAAQHTALLALSARAAGVAVPASLGAAQAEDSWLLVRERIEGRPLASLSGDEIPDAVLRGLWDEIRRAHKAGIAHRSLSASHVIVGPAGKPWLIGWDSGEIAATRLSKRIDMAQLVGMAAAVVGTERALKCARENLSPAEITSLTPLLQWIVLPKETRAALPRRQLNELREGLTRDVPTAASAPAVSVERFTLRKLLTISVASAALLVLFGTFNWSDVAHAFGSADPLWLLAAFGAGLSTYFGAAVGLKYFTPEPLGLWRSTLVQVASSIVSLVAPAGIGPAAIDLRYLTKQRVDTTLAVATVSLLQFTRFLTTVALLILVTLLTGDARAGSLAAPSGTAVAAIVGTLLVGGILIAIPPVRSWALRRIGPTLQQIWPRIVWVLANPARLGLGVLGHTVQAVGYVAAFGLTLQAFGYSLPVATLAITYLASASAGSLVPSPGGVGPVELALTSGLTIAGIPSAVAVSVVLAFRVLTLWARLPLGWLSLRYLQKRDVL